MSRVFKHRIKHDLENKLVKTFLHITFANVETKYPRNGNVHNFLLALTKANKKIIFILFEQNARAQSITQIELAKNHLTDSIGEFSKLSTRKASSAVRGHFIVSHTVNTINRMAQLFIKLRAFQAFSSPDLKTYFIDKTTEYCFKGGVTDLGERSLSTSKLPGSNPREAQEFSKPYWMWFLGHTISRVHPARWSRVISGRFNRDCGSHLPEKWGQNVGNDPYSLILVCTFMQFTPGIF